MFYDFIYLAKGFRMRPKVRSTLNNLVEQFNWDDVINETVNIDDATKIFSDRFIKFCKACIPRKRGLYIIREHVKPWFTSELRRNMSLIMRKPVYAICEQQRHRSACASAQSDQRRCYPLPG